MANESLLEIEGIQESMKDILLKAMDYASGLEKVSYADARIIKSASTSMAVSTKEESAQSGTSFGIGVRVLASGMWGYSSSQSCELEALKQAIESAKKSALCAAAKNKEPIEIDAANPIKDTVRILGKESVFGIPFEERRKILCEMVDFASAKEIIFSQASLTGSVISKLFANTEGSDIETCVERTRIGLTAVAKSAEKQTMNYDVFASQGGFEGIKSLGLEEFSKNISKKAILFLSAKKPPAGKMDVLMSPQVGGTLVHEVFGHAAEADWIACGRSLLSKKLGQKMASDIVTIYDDGSIPGAWGSIYYDDEGVKCKKNVLLENGVLKQYMHTRQTAKKLGMQVTGNGRLQDFTHMVIPRMTNTALAPGDATFEEMVSMVKKGILVDKFTIALEDPAGGSFEIKALGGCRIENGKLAAPINRTTLSSSSFIETLSNIAALSKKYEGRDGAGMCGKGHENWVPVGNPSPYVLIKDLTVSGV